MRRLVVLSILLILAGLAFLLPSSALYSLLTKGTTSTTTTTVFRLGASAPSSGSDNTTTIESLVGFGLIGVGAVLEVLSLFTDVGGVAPSRAGPHVDAGTLAPAVPAAPKPGENKP